MNFMPNARCLKLATEAANDKLTTQEILDAFQRIDERRAKLEASGNIADRDAKLRQFAAEEAQKTRIEAARIRRNAALTIIAESKTLEAVRSMVGEGRSRAQGLSATMMGTQTGVKFGRRSFLTLEQGFTDKYIDAGFIASVLKEKPHLAHMLEDKRFDADLAREMNELRAGGKPGVTGNADAQFVAKQAADYLELARTDGNARGANIGRVDGYMGPQNHDADRLLDVPARVWATRFLARLDVERTFPDITDKEDMLAIIQRTHYKITTGFDPNVESAAAKGQRMGPSNLASALSRERVYHFASVEDALAYRDEFGHGGTLDGILNHLRRMAHANAAMEAFGPNPKASFEKLRDTLKRDIATDKSLSEDEQAKQTHQLDDQWGVLKYGIDTVTGEQSAPQHRGLATIANEARTLQGLARLGGMIWSQVGDTITPAIAATFRGGNGFRAFTDQLSGVLRGRPRGEQAEITYMLGEGMDGLVGHIINAHAASDTRLGFISKHSSGFYKWNGARWWTDVTRGAAVRTISAEMAIRSKAAFGDLPKKYAHFLGLHGIDAGRWEAIRQARASIADGRQYITPDRVNELPDNAIEHLIDPTQLADARAAGNDQVAHLFAQTKDDLVMSVRRLFADETNYAILQPDAASRRFTTAQLRPGTAAGEAIRLISQFQSFPAAFTQRSLGRLIYGYGKSANLGQALAERAPHIGSLVAGLFIAGYLSMVLKDTTKGYWPPRNPLDGRTIMAAFLQSGAAGIYGDFIFGTQNRFGGDMASTLLGPTIGTAIDAWNVGADARDFASSGGQDPFSAPKLFDLAVNNNPIWPMNLWYTKAALDYLVMNSIREALKPGYLKSKDRRREKDYGQQIGQPVPGAPRSLDPLNITRSF